MHINTNHDNLITSISKYLGTHEESISLYFKGRVALYSILQAMDISSNDEVLIPAYTCVVVPNAVKYLNATPRYIDIDLRTYSVNPETVERSITNKTKAVTCQNTYGLSYGVDRIASICRDHNIYSIEDCTHGFGGTYKNKPNGSWCDAAFYSSQWNKPFSTGLGGYGIVNDETLQTKVASFAASLPVPNSKTQIMLWLLIKIRSLVKPSTYYTMVEAYRYLSKHNMVTGSSSGEELEGIEEPEDYLQGMSNIQMKEALKSLKSLPELNKLRKENGIIYTDYLATNNLNNVDESLHDDHLFLKYPLLVRDKKAFVQRAKQSRIPLGDWFSSPLHPVEGDLSKWDYSTEEFPNAVFASNHVVNIPTDCKDPHRVIEFLDKNKDLIYDKTVEGRIE